MIGQRVGHFEVIEELGRGGMGVVYRAHDPRLGRDVALKVMHAERLGDERRRRRFLREARTVSRLAHPGIVTLFDILESQEIDPDAPTDGRTADAQTADAQTADAQTADAQTADVLVMELVRGRSLRHRLRRGPLPWTRAAALAAELAEAMVEAHRVGIVHRDLKPENLVVNDDGRLKVLDFGLAKLDPLLGTDGATDIETLISSLSTDRRLGAGTVAYMPPEQALGETVDFRSDIYAFGVLLYEMLAGRRPFRGDSAMKVVKASLYEPPPTPRPPDGAEPWPDELTHLVLECLEKKPEERPEGFASIAERLRRMLDEETSPAPVSGSWPEARKIPSPGDEAKPGTVGPDAKGPGTGGASSDDGSRSGQSYAPLSGLRPRSARLLLVALGLGVLVGLGLVLDPGSRAPESGVEPRPSAPVQAGPTTPPSAYDFYLQARQRLDRYDRPGHIDQALERLEQALELDNDNAAVHAALAEAHCHRYRVDNADPLFLDRAESHARRALELDSHLALAHLAIARVAAARGLADEALDALEQAAVLDPLDPQVPLLRGIAHEGAGELGAAEETFRRAVELAPDSREAHDYLGSLLFRLGRFEEADAAFLRAVELAPDSYISRRNRAGSLQMLGHYPEAAAELQESLAIRPNWSTYTNLGTLQYFRGLYAEAIVALERAIDLGANDYLAWANLADAYRQSPVRRGEAPEAYRRAIQIAEEQLAEQRAGNRGRGEADDPQLVSRIALYTVKSGDAETALGMARSLKLDTDDATLLGRLVQVFELAGERTAAIELLERALDAGYPLEVIRSEPELLALRRDPDYHRLLARRGTDPRSADSPSGGPP